MSLLSLLSLSWLYATQPPAGVAPSLPGTGLRPAVAPEHPRSMSVATAPALAGLLHAATTLFGALGRALLCLNRELRVVHASSPNPRAAFSRKEKRP